MRTHYLTAARGGPVPTVAAVLRAVVGRRVAVTSSAFVRRDLDWRTPLEIDLGALIRAAFFMGGALGAGSNLAVFVLARLVG